MPKVSICIPSYNGARYIERTIRSVLSQRYQDYELLINDDCSTDETISIAGMFAGENSRVRIYANESRLGLTGNWNEAMSHATGEYIKLLCQDDLLEPDCIEKQMGILENFRQVTLVTCAAKVIDSNDKVILKRKYWHGSKTIDGRKASRTSLLGINLFGEPSALMFRRKDKERIGLYDARYGYVPDWDYSLRLLEEGDLYHIDEFLTQFRVNSDTESGRLLNEKLMEICLEEFDFFNRNSKRHGFHFFHKGLNHLVVLFKNIFYKLFQNLFFNHPGKKRTEVASFGD